MKRFGIKLIAVSLLAIGIQILSQILFNHFENAFPFPEKTNFETLLRNKTDGIILGDSSVFWVAASDTLKKDLPTLIVENSKNITLGSVTHAAYNLPVFEKFISFSQRTNQWPKTFLIPINLRSFSPLWTHEPTWQFEVEKTVLVYGDNLLFQSFFRFLYAMKWFTLPGHSAAEFKHKYEGIKNALRHAQLRGDEPDVAWTNERLVEHFAQGYAIPIHAEHPYLKSLEKIDSAVTEGTEVFFYIPPLDFQGGSRILGPLFQERVANNIARIRSVVHRHHVVDLSRLLGSEHFDGENGITTEHLKETGRFLMARKLAQILEMNMMQAALD